MKKLDCRTLAKTPEVNQLLLLFLKIHLAWQGRQDSNLRPSVLETDALPTELLPYLPADNI